MENFEIDSYYTRLDDNNIGHVMVVVDNETLELGTIGDCSTINAVVVHERAENLLKINNVTLKPTPAPTPKPKRKYTRRDTTLGLASDFGKVELKLVEPEKRFIKGYHLYLKGTNKFVYKITPKGILVMEDLDGTRKTKPLVFTENDIKRIKNIDDFDVKKFDIETKFIKNKIA